MAEAEASSGRRSIAGLDLSLFFFTCAFLGVSRKTGYALFSAVKFYLLSSLQNPAVACKKIEHHDSAKANAAENEGCLKGVGAA
jgi:hypothetical protein